MTEDSQLHITTVNHREGYERWHCPIPLSLKQNTLVGQILFLPKGKRFKSMLDKDRGVTCKCNKTLSLSCGFLHSLHLTILLRERLFD